MKKDPNIVKILREAEKQGILYLQPEYIAEPSQPLEHQIPAPVIYTDKDTVKRTTEYTDLGTLEEKYRTIFNNYTVAITIADNKERIISWNRYTEELLNMTENELYLTPVNTLYPVEEWEKIRSENVRQKGFKYQIETKMIKKNHESFNVELSLCVLKSVHGKIVGSIGIIKDITKQKEIEKALIQSEERFQQLYEKAPVPYHTLSPSGIITNVNETWCQIFGYTKKEVIGTSIFAFVIENERKAAEISFKKKLLNKKPYSTATERTYVTKNGEQRIFVIHDFFSFNEQYNVNAVYTIMDDVTELKKITQELRNHQHHLEELVDERTAKLKIVDEQLKKVDERLQQEINMRKQTEINMTKSTNYFPRLLKRLFRR